MGRYGAKMSNVMVEDWSEVTEAGAEGLAVHVAASDPHTGYQKESEKGSASGYASLDGTVKVPIAQVPTGSTSSTVCLGNDGRLSDARTPLSHTHAESEITNLTSDLSGKQASDATLTALAGLNSTAGLVEQTGADVFTKRLIGVANSTDIPSRADGDARFAAASHSHPESDVTSLVSDLAGKAASVHTHAESEITGLEADLAPRWSRIFALMGA